MQLGNNSVFQALNPHSTHRTKHCALILCQNIAVLMTSLYHTVFCRQKSLFFFVNCYNIRAVFGNILRNFTQLCRIFGCNFLLRLPNKYIS